MTRKLTVPGYDFIEYPAVDKAMGFADQVWMGHNRFKTTGDISKANAHPFEVCDDEDYVLLVGAHNGTLNNKWDLERELKEKYDTDSEALFNLLIDKPTFKEAVALLKGAWSLTFWDPTTDCFHLLRNEERPMTYAWSKDHKVMVYASEPWMIINACRRNNMELEKDEKGLSCISTLPNNLYSFHIPQDRDKPIVDVDREGGYTGAPVKPFRTAWDGIRRTFEGEDWWGENDPNRPAALEETEKKATSETKSGTPNTKKDGEQKAVVTIGFPDFKGYQGQNLTVAQLTKIRDKGCGWCGDPMQVGKKFAFLDESTMVCHNCIDGTHGDGDRVRPDIDYDSLIDPDEDFDDPLPFNLRPHQTDTPEGRKLAAAAAKKSVG